MQLSDYHIILGSASPRRKQLLESLGLKVDVRKKEIPEDFPESLSGKYVALHIAENKAIAFDGEIGEKDLLITADTIVCLGPEVLGKPLDEADAQAMLSKMQGTSHQVYTAVCLTTSQQRNCFTVESSVWFKPLSKEQILDYIRHYKPYDKAGSYGAQECLPAGMNPCSAGERAFLKSVGKPFLFEDSLAVDESRHVPIIDRIEGSYFNVMGLPVAELWDAIHSLKKTN